MNKRRKKLFRARQYSPYIGGLLKHQFESKTFHHATSLIDFMDSLGPEFKIHPYQIEILDHFKK